jgi:hypothetical protein
MDQQDYFPTDDPANDNSIEEHTNQNINKSNSQDNLFEFSIPQETYLPQSIRKDQVQKSPSLTEIGYYSKRNGSPLREMSNKTSNCEEGIKKKFKSGETEVESYALTYTTRNQSKYNFSKRDI